MHPVEVFAVAAILGLFGLGGGEIIFILALFVLLISFKRLGGTTERRKKDSLQEQSKGHSLHQYCKMVFASHPFMAALTFILAAVAVFLVVHEFSK